MESVAADVNDEPSVDAAVDGVFAAVNVVSLYVEHGSQTFHSVHVEAAARVARRAHAAGAQRLVHISGIGADPGSTSSYIRSRGLGETGVREAFPSATIVRPAVMFGADDAFLTSIESILRRSPLYPLFGNGETLLQPAHVEDVAEAIARCLSRPDPGSTYELGGPRILSYRNLIRSVGERIGVRPVLVPVPFLAWRAAALAAEFLPHPPLTRNQVELMEIDNIAARDALGFASFDIAPRDMETAKT